MITTEQVKMLRDKTGVSVMQCKKALEETDGDIEKALVILRKKGSEIAAKKADRSAQDGVVVIKSDGKKAVALTVQCETDFVAKNEDFKHAAQTLAEIAFDQGALAAQEQAPALLNDVVLKIGENIQLGSIDEFAGDTIGTYTHFNGKNGAVVVLSGGTPELAKDIAMHVAAMKPGFLSAEDIPAEAKTSASEVFKKEVMESGKPEEMQAKILEGKLGSYFKEQTLLDQLFFKTGDISIRDLVSKAGATVERFEVYLLG